MGTGYTSNHNTVNTQDVSADNEHNVCYPGSKSPPDEYGGRGDQQHDQRSLGPSGGHYLCDNLERIDETGKMGEKKGKILFFQIYLNNEKNILVSRAFLPLGISHTPSSTNDGGSTTDESGTQIRTDSTDEPGT